MLIFRKKYFDAPDSKMELRLSLPRWISGPGFSSTFSCACMFEAIINNRIKNRYEAGMAYNNKTYPIKKQRCKTGNIYCGYAFLLEGSSRP